MFLCFYLSGQSVPSVLVFKQLRSSPLGFPHGFWLSDVNSSPIGRFQIHLSLLLSLSEYFKEVGNYFTKARENLGQTCQESQQFTGFPFQNMTFAANVSDLSHLVLRIQTPGTVRSWML